jgi:hypothetical protein
MVDFTAFKNAFTGDIVTQTDPDYDKAISVWACNAIRRAKVVACVRSAADVVLAINYARANQLPIAVRGGSHNPFGASSSEDGLVIDLSRHLNTTRIDPDKRLAYVGGGAVWEAVDKAAIEHGLATVSGTINHVSHLLDPACESKLISDHRWVWEGLSHSVPSDGHVLTTFLRLLLGGGFGWLTGSHGLVIDNLQQVYGR